MMLSPKEKAEQLVDKFRNKIMSFLSDNQKDQNAIQCALIAVDEIENAIDFDWMEVQNLESEHRYWQEVKQEIINYEH